MATGPAGIRWRVPQIEGAAEGWCMPPDQLMVMSESPSTSDSDDVDVLDLQDVLQRFGFHTICMVAFGHDLPCLADGGVMEDARSDFMHSFGEAQNLVVGRFFDLIEVSWKIKKWLNVGTIRRLRKAIADVHTFAMDIVRARRQSASVQDRDDVLSRFVASDEHSDEVLRDIVLSFLIVGRDTTASGLSWFFCLLSSRPDVVARIADEVRAVRKPTDTRLGEPFRFDALWEMHYLHAALTESMRLYPPASVILNVKAAALL
ncbi:cytochrome P450 CYP94D108-like [Oryza glaberrima]|uniref:cytochrome P450 CYP94D108-like n=1 Tax=Oryza glaberrima TaxID=4538 RepID=UPI00224C336D|nr:cytochrome P450 CYP94D108-like [Oryza glaberrima]